MSNHSTAHPNGILDRETLKSFFAITEAADGTLTYTPGYERIPDNWYRRPLDPATEYSPLSFAQDLVQLAVVVPEAVSVGGNTGTVNSFAGVDLGDITGGAYHTSDLLVPSKFVCYFYQLTLALVPDFLRSESLGTALAGALTLLHNKIDPFVDPSCAKIGKLVLFRFFSFFFFFAPFSHVKRWWTLTEMVIGNYNDTFTAQFPGAAVGRP